MGRQWKLNLDTGNAFLVNSKATERHVKEQQASLEQWAKDQTALDKLFPGQLTIDPETGYISDFEHEEDQACPLG